MSDFVYGRVLLSNNDGETWYSVDAGNPDSAIGVDLNERRVMQLDNGSVQINLHRYSANFAEVQYHAKTCAGSDGNTLSCRKGREVMAKLAFSGPNSQLFRTGLTLWTSAGNGTKWFERHQIDAGFTGHASVQLVCEAETFGSGYSYFPCQAFLFYEQADRLRLSRHPDRLVFRTLRWGDTALPVQRHSGHTDL
jgi:hypothetical protein